jgi:hypothetical protein
MAKLIEVSPPSEAVQAALANILDRLDQKYGLEHMDENYVKITSNFDVNGRFWEVLLELKRKETGERYVGTVAVNVGF